jgi:dipeptidyl aminopeptidase/acylaminoacyl peptidase
MILTLLVLLLAGAGSSAVAKDANAHRPLDVDDYFALKSVGDPRISPDGEWVAYTVRSQDLEEDSRETQIWMVPTAGGEALPMAATGNSAWSPRWSPNGKYLSFLSERNGSDVQVFTLDLRGGEAVQLTSIGQGVEGFEWSPDGTKLALVIRDQDPVTGTVPWVIDRLTFKADYVGYLNRLRSHLYVFDVDTKAVIQVTSGDFEDYSPAWSPDGSTIAFTSNRTAEPDDNTNSDIWLVKPDTPHDKQEWVRVTTNPGADDSAVWHPDGERLAYLTTTRTDIPMAYQQTNQPIIHSEQMYQAMKQLGREASLIVYPDAHHGIRRPTYHKDLLERFLGRFDKYVKNPQAD